MIEQNAIILATESRSESHKDGPPMATIEVVRKSACGLCGQTTGCGNAFWGKLFAHKASNFKAQNHINATVGQNVIVGIDEAAVMKSALILYLVPLAAMLLSAILATQLVETDLSAMLGAIIGLVLGYYWVKAHIAGHAYYQNHQPTILRLDTATADIEAIQFQ